MTASTNLPPLPDPEGVLFVSIAQGGRTAIHGAYQVHDMHTYGLACAAAATATQAAEIAELRKDAGRFAWWLGLGAKAVDVTTLIEGARAGWSLDQWRHFIDAAIAAKEQKG